MNSKEHFFQLFKRQKARELAQDIDEYLYHQSPYKDEVEDYHGRCNDGIRTDCIGYISRKGAYKFVSLTASRHVCLVLHLGRKLHTQKALAMQKSINEMLSKIYADSEHVKPTPGEAYIHIEWVDNLKQIIPLIDEAYYLRLKK
jgi:hypothetical protein